MIQTILKIDGMMCGMCESHINDAIREEFTDAKVTSSHKKGETVIICANPLDKDRLAIIIEKAGYQLLSYHEIPYEKKPLLHRWIKK